jgi:hypothetical protein
VVVLHGAGDDPTTRTFRDVTSSIDPVRGTACGSVTSFSRFAVATSDVCGNGRPQSDGFVTVAGGLAGRTVVVVDGVSDCSAYPPNLPRRLAKYCVPDADPTPGSCTLALSLGTNRVGCNRAAPGATAYSPGIDVSSYKGSIRHGSASIDLTSSFGPSIAALASPTDAVVGPLDVALPASTKITTYKLRHEIRGLSATGNGASVRDRDVLTVKCIDPSRF